MSVYLVPKEGFSVERLSIANGTMTNHSFANGSYPFSAANDGLIGFYETCTLFSSMADFDSHHQVIELQQMLSFYYFLDL